VRDAVSTAQTGVSEPPRQTRRASTPGGGRSQANRLFKKPDACERCRESKRLDWHHVNADPTDNRRDNLRALCRRCHQIEDGRHDFLTNDMPRLGRHMQLRGHDTNPSNKSI
jgi:cytochrome c1